MGRDQPSTGADRDATGKYTETYPREAFVEAIEAEDGAAGTQDVADRVGCAYQTAYAKLRALEDAGEVSHRRVGNARLWTVTS